jgi:putative transcriptional regulator
MNVLVATCLGLLSVALTTLAQAAATPSPVILVASGSGVERYGETVVLALPIEDGSHFGFVLNRPTEATVRDLFPDEALSNKVVARVDIGGPALRDKLFALVVDPDPRVEGLRQVSPRFSVAIEIDEVDRVIAAQPDNTRFFLGLVMWMPGDLDEQVGTGAWRVIAPDVRIVLSPQPTTLWQRLSKASAQRVALSK